MYYEETSSNSIREQEHRMVVDFRSDTFTKPTKEMREAMFNAEVGDDVFGEDPTVKRLEETAAEMVGTEAAIFVSSGTMGNLIASSPEITVISRKKLFEIMQNCKCKDFDHKLNFMEDYLLKKQNYSEVDVKAVKDQLHFLKLQFRAKWVKAKRTSHAFCHRNEKWLNGTVSLPVAKNVRGRPSKSFSDSSERSKRRKTESIRKSTDVDELMFATHMKLRTTGQAAASQIVQTMMHLPSEALSYKKAYSKNPTKKQDQLTPFGALCMFIEADLSRKQYEIIRLTNKKFYPCYTLLQKEKKQCYPDPESYRITESHVEINLQSLLNHTAVRLVQYLAEVLESLPETDLELELISKWGCDGSKQDQFKQLFDESCSSDENIFQSSLVPLQLSLQSNDRTVIWQNRVPSSPRYCRPIRVRFLKESIDVTKDEVNYINSQISKLTETKIDLPKNIRVKHTLLFTMVDGKVCNSITDTKSTNRCYICGASSKDFNNLSRANEIQRETLQFGLSILHARIRFLEHLLHLSYKLPLQKWQARTNGEKAVVQKRKRKIHNEFKAQLGLNIDVPKPGFGNTNDGNSSRRFFNNHEVSSEITGIDNDLIYRLKVILETISSGYRIDTDKFATYAMDTAKKYVELYPWYPMSPTIHKILVHGALVIETSLLPIGQLSEEAAEARNKHFRHYRQHFSRKFSRVACNRDVINRLLISSDPLITSLRKLPRKKKNGFSSNTLAMLLPMTSTYSGNSDGSGVDSEN